MVNGPKLSYSPSNEPNNPYSSNSASANQLLAGFSAARTASAAGASGYL